MAVEELLKNSPEFIEQIVDALGKNPNYDKVKLQKGLFIFPSKEYFKHVGILGFNSKIKVTLIYSLDKNDPLYEKPEKIRIKKPTWEDKDPLFPYFKSRPQLKIGNCSYNLKETKKSFEGDIKLDKNNPLSIDIILDSAPQKIFAPYSR